MIKINRRLLGVGLVLGISACQEGRVEERANREIKEAINKYFGEDPNWRINEPISCQEPTVVHTMAALRMDLEIGAPTRGSTR